MVFIFSINIILDTLKKKRVPDGKEFCRVRIDPQPEAFSHGEKGLLDSIAEYIKK